MKCFSFSPHIGRYSPVRRASEGSKINTQPFQGALQECQQLQKATQRHLLTTQSPPLADNAVSLPGSYELFEIFWNCGSAVDVLGRVEC